MHFETKQAVPIKVATLVSFICFGLGALFAYFLLMGSNIPLKCFDAGNAADWWAAGGTWVIGIGAIIYSARELGLKVHERREKRLKELLEEMNIYKDPARRAKKAHITLIYLHGEMERLAEFAAGPGTPKVPASVLDRLVQTVMEDLKDLVWSEALMAGVTSETAERLMRAEGFGRGLRHIFDFWQANTHGDLTDRLPLTGLIEHITDVHSRLIEVLAEIPELLREDSRYLQAQIDNLRWRIAVADEALLK